jgi:glycosyltransferase involved in cell wall biosynthesis
MTSPAVSVVMGVYNGGSSLDLTLDSVLGQEGVDLEFIVVDDGSTDDTPRLLAQRARHDARLRVLRQPNAGLTAALVRGCALARGTFIARQDAGGDISLPGRLVQQVAALRSRPEAVLSTCGTRFVTPEGELLFDKVIAQAELDAGLNTLAIPGVTGPSSHPSCLFRRDAYERVGGYRAAFTLAQDLDLWLRLVEAGRFVAMSAVLYQACWTPGGLTSRLRPHQLRYAEIALEAARCRRDGHAEPALPAPQRSLPLEQDRSRRSELSRFHYFVGACVAVRDPSRARRHFLQAVRAQPSNLRALWRVLQPARSGRHGR